MNRIAAVAILILVPLCAYPVTVEEIDENNDGVADQWIEMLNDAISRITVDRDFDGVADYTLVLDEDSRKIEEALDFNFDGEMDDFYYYEEGVLVRREIDSNFDGFVDIYVYVDEGVYIKKIERDTDFDGEIDFIKDYDAAGS